MDLRGTPVSPRTKVRNKSCYVHSSIGQHQFKQTQSRETEETRATQPQEHSPKMVSSISQQLHSFPIIPTFVAFLLVVSTLLSPVLSIPENQTLRTGEELIKLKNTRALLRKINKVAVKTIQSPDGDLIDCVKSHLQPAFDHPQLQGKKPLDPPERPKGLNSTSTVKEILSQLWTSSNEACPEGTVPIRRTTEKDVLRASAMKRFGRKWRKPVKKDSVDQTHEHAVGFVNGQYYGAKASISVWEPHVTNPYEFSLSQLWVISGSFGHDLNTIEAGWQVSPELYGDSRPRFFTYWTSDAYQTTGCYNLLCSGFVQINSKIAIGAAISPSSSYKGGQFDIGLMVWKDPRLGNWWLQYGGLLVGYWPAFLFSHLRASAGMIQFGGEIVNNRAWGTHTATQMGSGHFANEGYKKAAYFRNLQVVDSDNSLIRPYGLRLYADHPNCYSIAQGHNNVWGTYFYYGGPGRNVRCP